MKNQSSQENWLAALWPEVRSHLPRPPSVVVELGCGRFGGFVPRLADDGYQVIGIDPVAPEGPSYRQVEFEQSELPERVGGMIACTSLHHVAEPDRVLDRIASALAPAGVVVVVEWDWEGFDEATARWAFKRLDGSESESWLHRRRDEWRGSGRTWEESMQGWAREHGLHSARGLLGELDARFERLSCARGPFLFPELSQTSEADERAAIEAGEIRALRVDYVGRVG